MEPACVPSLPGVVQREIVRTERGDVHTDCLTNHHPFLSFFLISILPCPGYKQMVAKQTRVDVLIPANKSLVLLVRASLRCARNQSRAKCYSRQRSCSGCLTATDTLMPRCFSSYMEIVSFNLH